MAGRVRAAYRRLAEVDRPEVWIALLPAAEAAARAAGIDARVRAGEDLPLAGLLVAVKDNVDVAGFATTAACPPFAHEPATTAPAVARLVAAGALVLGKTNLDQFATGLVGTRSPYGAVRAAWHPDRVAGGSSSGSAVAVALGVVDLGIGTDTAGSGRVPAALNRIVGVKPTRGLVPTTGVVPAARPYDCVSVFARDLGLAAAALRVMTGPDGVDPLARPWPDAVRLAAPPVPRVAVPRAVDLADLTPARRASFARAADGLRTAGADVVEFDAGVIRRAAGLLYGSGLVAERHAAVGPLVEAEIRAGDGPTGAVDPDVAAVVLAAAAVTGPDLARAQAAADALRLEARTLFDGVDALLVPTTPRHPTPAEVTADPVGVNAAMGTWTNGVNLLDLAAVAVPAADADGGCFGVTVVARAFDDQVALDIAALLAPPEPGAPPRPRWPDTGVELVVFGAHMRGEPLNHQLVALGGAFVDEVDTAPDYRMVALPTAPPKPGIVPAGPGRGGTLRGERWLLPPAGLGRFLAALPPPMALGRISLAAGASAIGFLCDAASAEGAPDITHLASWRTHVRRPAEPGARSATVTRRR